MLYGIYETFLSLFNRGPERDAENEEGTNRFVPSPLDVSVRVAHGGPDDEVQRELSKIEEQAREIEEHQHE